MEQVSCPPFFAADVATAGLAAALMCLVLNLALVLLLWRRRAELGAVML